MAKKASKEQGESNVSILDSVIEEMIEKGSIYGARAGSQIIPQDKITTGSFEFDMRLGGGFRSSSWTRIYGVQEGGKTSIGLTFAKNWQDFYGPSALVLVFNAEGRITLDLLERSGIDTSPERFRVIDTNKYEAILTIIEKCITNNSDKRHIFSLIDSTDALVVKADEGKGFDEATKISGGAVLASLAGKRLSILTNLSSHHIFVTSQNRAKMQVGSMSPGGGVTSSGGLALSYYPSMIAEVKKPWSERFIYEDPTDNKSRIIGRMCELKLEKTPNETSGSTVLYPIKYNHRGSIWREYEAMIVAQSCGLIIKQGGGWYEWEPSIYEDMKGKSIQIEPKIRTEIAVRNLFDSNPDLVNYCFEKGKIVYQAKKDLKL